VRRIASASHVGEFVAIVGASGSGKIDLDEHPRPCSIGRTPAGHYLFGGDDVGVARCETNKRACANKKVGFVFQAFSPACRGTSRRWRTSKLARCCIPTRASLTGLGARRLLDAVGLTDRMQPHSVRNLSGGQQQRVAIAPRRARQRAGPAARR